ncbi:hypothetical protein Rumeso_03334 [Rubellimicrobium mesophilum DSM 19309]|uniref:Uncharacterized protein n=1 Tax=Rubellimicrobium mesophilum DSM 19309 TaxID=442562 RepID=A0A017HLB1_9RHOB|nr:hypothetical protein [Rubellimicrobium mesophilum]EYD75095.1 hypothetical protein Rumeso_03334 [Rubellimicrobium mesophilum DSM 19309]
MTHRDHIAPLGPLLEAVASEVDASRQAILTAEHHFAAALRGEADPESLTRDFQGIDLALQVLNDLQGFLGRLAAGLTKGASVDAGPGLRNLTLERLAGVLAAAAGAQAPVATPQPSIELF